jgi:flagellar hook assembly protein FlgD
MPELRSASPNPFNPSTKIEFSVPKKGLTELAIFNSRGERVRTLVSRRLEGGVHSVDWDGRDQGGAAVSSGTYYARLRFETLRPSVAKLTLLK